MIDPRAVVTAGARVAADAEVGPFMPSSAPTSRSGRAPGSARMR